MLRIQMWVGQLISKITITFYPSIKTSINQWYHQQSNDNRPDIRFWVLSSNILQPIHYFYILPIREGCYHKSRRVSQIFVPVTELGVTDVCEAILLRRVPPQTSVSWVGNHLCRSWDCHMKAKEDSILFRIILLTTSLEWTSIVQIVITFKFVIDLVNKDFTTFCLSPFESEPRRRVMRLLSIPICFL